MSLNAAPGGNESDKKRGREGDKGDESKTVPDVPGERLPDFATTED